MDSAEDTLLTVREVARMLQLNERTVIRLASDGELPGDKLGGQWRFSGKLIRDWLEQRMLQRVSAPPATEEPAAPSADEVANWERLGLAELVPIGNVRSRMQARTAAGVLAELAEMAAARGYVREAERLAGALALRESLDPTATENGIALLHARRRLPRGHVSQPFILIGRSVDGVPFGAPDGGTTHLFFLLVLLADTVHLQWLGHLARALRSPGAIAGLLGAGDDESLRAAALAWLDRPAAPVSLPDDGAV